MCALKIDYGIDYFGGKRFQYRRIFVGIVISRFTPRKGLLIPHGGAICHLGTHRKDGVPVGCLHLFIILHYLT